MKTEGQIRQQLKQVLFRHLQRRLKNAFRRIPETCQHNKTLGKIGFCGLQSAEQKDVVVCDSAVVGCSDKARVCPFWKSKGTKAEIKAEFRALVEGDKGRLAAEHPDVVALLWVLGTSDGLAADLDDLVAGPGRKEEPSVLELAGSAEKDT